MLLQGPQEVYVAMQRSRAGGHVSVHFGRYDVGKRGAARQMAIPRYRARWALRQCHVRLSAITAATAAGMKVAADPLC